MPSPALAARLRVRRLARDMLGVPRAARYSLAWDLLAGAFAGAYMGAIFPFITRIARGELHAPDAAIAWMSAAPFVGNLLAPLWARQMEGRAKMPFVLGSWIPARMLLLLMPLLVTAWPFVLAIGLLQFIGTISSPAYTSLMKDIYPDAARGRLMGYVRVSVQSLMFVSTLIVGPLLDHGVGYGLVFPVAGTLGILAALCFARVRPLPQEEIPQRLGAEAGPTAFARDTLSILRENVPYRWFAFSVTSYGLGNLMAQPLYALFQVEALHITNTQIAHLVNVASILAIVGSFFWGRFIDRYGAPRAVFLSICCVASISFVYLFARSVTPLYFSAALAGIGFAGIELSYMASILAYAEPGRAAQYQALHSFLLGLRGIVAPLIALPLARALGWQAAFVVTLVFMFAGAAMQWFAIRTAEARAH